MGHSTRFWLAALFAPLVAPVVFKAIWSLDGPAGPYLDIVFVVATVIAYLGFGLLGLPVLIYLRRKSLLTARNVLLAGMILGVSLGVAVPPLLAMTQGKPLRFSLGFVPLTTVSGFLIGAVFALLAGVLVVRNSDNAP